MPEVLSRFQQKTSEIWTNLDKSQKNRIYIISSILVVAITIFIVMSTRTSYVTLINSNDSKEIKEIIRLLEDERIKFKLSQDQKTILVDSKSMNKAKVAIAKSDTLRFGGSIFADAFSKIKINTTESDKRKLWEDTEERIIAERLKMLDNIEDASVDLALPKDSLFLLEGETPKRPTASVMIKPKEKLTSKQVQAVVMMVARSVENLDPKDISVVDNNLNELNPLTGDEPIDIANSQYDLRMKRQKELENNVYKMFTGQFESFDSIAVVANPVLDFDKLKSKSKEISNPAGQDEGALISSDITTENLVNGGANGVPGTDTNPGNTDSPAYQVGNGDNSQYNKKHEIKNFEYNEVLKEEEKATGQLMPDKSTMAINLKYGERVVDEELINEEINKVKQIASSATGIPVANIVVHKFKKAAPPAPAQKQLADTIRQMVNDYGLFAVMLLLIIGLMLAAIPKKKRTQELEPALEQAAATGPRFVVPEMQEDPLPEIGFEERSEVKKQIDKFVKQKPEAVAQLLRNWLSDDWD